MNALPTTRMLAGVLSVRVVDEDGNTQPEAPQSLAEIASLQQATVSRFRGHVVRAGAELLATFDSVAAALSAGFAMQRKVSRKCANGAGICVGLDGGDVFFSGEGCMGDVVDNAVRLSDAARPGHILLSGVAHALLGNRYAIDVDTSGSDLKVEWKTDRSRRCDSLPQALAQDKSPFAGRQKELGQMLAALDSAMDGRAGWLSVTGDPGVGKTRLISELARKAREREMLVLYGVADEDSSRPYGPIVEALQFWIEGADDLELCLCTPSGELLRILPELEQRVPDLHPPVRSDAENERRQLFTAVAGMLNEICSTAPVLLILDSLHWEGDPTIEMLREVLTHVSSAQLLIVATYRDGDHRAQDLLQRARERLGSAAVAEIRLGPLSEADVAALLADAGRDSHDLAAAVHLVTGGLPLHVSALLGNEAALAGSSSSLPGNVRDALNQRLQSLQPESRKIVEAASVLGERFTAMELADLVNDPDQTFEVLDDLIEAGIFRLVDSRALIFQFSHSMMREVATGGLGRVRAARLHERAGLALEARGELERERRVFDLARHFTHAAALGHSDRAVKYLNRAAQEALDQHANEDAAVLFQDALELLTQDDDVRTRSELETGLGQALKRLGKPEYRDMLMQAADRARTTGDGELMARALISRYRGTFSNAIHVDEALVGRMRQALQLLTDDNTGTRARLTSLLAVELVWADDRTEAQSLSKEAVLMAEVLRDTRVLAEVLAHRQWALFHPLSERVAAAERLQELASDHPDPRLKFEIANHQTFTWIRAGDRKRYEEALAQSNALADEIDEPSVRSLMLLRNTAAALMDAHFAEAETLMTQRRELELSIGAPDGEAAWRVHNFWLSFETLPKEQGQIIVRNSIGGIQHLPRYVYWAPMAAFAAEVGLGELSQPILSILGEDGFRNVPVDQVWLCNLCHLALATRAIGDVEKADDLISLIAPHCHEFANTVFMTVGSVARYVGILHGVAGNIAQAEQFLRDAIKANENMGAVTWSARSQLDLVEVLRSRDGVNDEADALVEQAAARASQLGLLCVLDRAENLRLKKSD